MAVWAASRAVAAGLARGLAAVPRNAVQALEVLHADHATVLRAAAGRSVRHAAFRGIRRACVAIGAAHCLMDLLPNEEQKIHHQNLLSWSFDMTGRALHSLKPNTDQQTNRII